MAGRGIRQCTLVQLPFAAADKSANSRAGAAIPARLPGVGIAVHSMLGMLEFELPQVEEMALRCS